MKKLLLTVVPAVFFLLLGLMRAYAADTVPVPFLSAAPYGGESERISFMVSGDYYLLFLPSDAPEAVAVYTGSTPVSIDGVPVTDGTEVTFASGQTEHSVAVGGSTVKLRVYRSAGLPAMFINTDSETLGYLNESKKHKDSAKIRVYSGGSLTLDDSLKQIKGRGNSTWNLPKKPYNIKFKDKTDLFGMGKAKKWSLLADYYDRSLLRNITAFRMGTEAGIPFTSECAPVDLYINGEYLGNYLVCESVEAGKTRVDINDLDSANEDANPGADIEALPRKGTGKDGLPEKGTVSGSAKWVELPNEPEDITNGYLLELDFNDRYDDEISGFVTERGQAVTVKSPEYASSAELRYIRSFYEQAEQAVFSPTGKNAEGRGWEEYFDMDSLIDMYILQELTMNVDSGISSCFFFLDDSGKLKAAPPWDFDIALGYNYPVHGVLLGNSSIWFANTNFYSATAAAPAKETVFTALYRHSSFRSAVSARWTQIGETLAGGDMIAFINETAGRLAESAACDMARWRSDDLQDMTAQTALTERYRREAEKVANFVSKRKTALDKGFSSDAAMLWYDLNGGSGCVSNNEIVAAGESAEVRSVTAEQGAVIPPAGKTFAGWCASADGTGEIFLPGSRITLTAPETTLFARWVTVCDPSGDGEVTPEDARIALRISVKLDKCERTEPAFFAADADADGEITAADARSILRRAVGLE